MNLLTSFNILDLDPQADAAQAKRAYKAQVRRWHPDQFPEGSATKARAEEQLKQINIAYARIRKHLPAHRPDPAVKSGAAHPQSHPDAAGARAAPDKQTNKRSWVDHLFETLNTLAGNRNGNPSRPLAEKNRTRPHRRFQQVLDEMAGGSISSSKKCRSASPGVATRRSAAGYGRRRHSGTRVGAVGGTDRPGPVKPVSRVRGIGRSR